MRSKINYLTALMWAYGSGKEDMPEAPLIATSRPGAWPEALELAMRMRNLEMIVNRPAIAKLTRQNISEFETSGKDIGLNERPLKAFWSAYRNLSGGAYKEKNSNDELTRSFELSEIAPKAFDAPPLSASSFLIPSDKSYANSKQYLDLQLMPLNLATMFSTFADTATNNAKMGNVVMDATCGVSKTAMPVPGYIIGFTKNPKVLTYYAVKAQSKFIGLFSPFRGTSLESGVTLTAYSAAKPFGGRIGPRLFTFDQSNQAVLARDGEKNYRSAAYVSGLVIDPSKTKFEPGMPIPFDSKNFWVSDETKAIGGVPGYNKNAYYSLPNMIYDFGNAEDLRDQFDISTNIQFINSDPKSTPALGLYKPYQLKALKNSIGVVTPGSSMTGQKVMEAIVRARRATKYDAINYLIPTFSEVSGKNNVARIAIKKDPIYQVGFTYKIFAPLTGPGLLYEADDVSAVVNSYISTNESAINQYLQSLLDVAESIYEISHNGAAGKVGDTTAAARSIHINAGTGKGFRPAPLVGISASDPVCAPDMASKFNHFFTGKDKECDVNPLVKVMVDFIQDRSNNAERSRYYINSYYDEDSPLKLRLKPEQLMTAYYPGERQRVEDTDSALNDHPLKISSPESQDIYSTRRNFYSTKFIQLSKVIEGKTDNDGHTPALSEGDGEIPADLNGVKVENLLKYDAANGIDKSYFLDF